MTPRRVAAPACGLVVALAVGLAAVAARHADPAEVSPVVPAGGWNTVWIAGLVAALAFYGLGVFVAARTALRVALAVGIAVVVQALPLVSPLLLSKDAYLYWGEARVITVHHASPYESTPSDYPNDPALPWVSEQWRAVEAPYGPVWEGLGTLPALAAGESAHDAQLGYRVLAFTGVLAALILVARRTRSAWTVAFLGWNPLVALHFSGGGHSDAWMVALLVLAVAARGTARAGAAWALAAGFKAFPLVLLPLELARRRVRQPPRFWVGLLGAGGTVAIVGTAFFGTGWVSASLVGAHQSSPLGGVHWLMQAGLSHRAAVVAGAVVFLAVYASLLLSAWRTGRARLSLASTALCLCSSLLRPWYALWPVALASAEEDGLAALAAFGLTAYLLLADAVAL
jgi:hypothetical protein